MLALKVAIHEMQKWTAFRIADRRVGKELAHGYAAGLYRFDCPSGCFLRITCCSSDVALLNYLSATDFVAAPITQ